MQDYMMVAIKEAKKAYAKKEVPVGAVIVKNNKIISKAHNQREKKQNVIKHAEIIALEKACKKLKTWRLEECEIYVTLEPCMMCCGAIEQSRIKKIIYATESPKYGYLKNMKNIVINKNVVYSNKCSDMMEKFFVNKRK